MAKRNPSELLAGAVVLLVAAGFLGYAVANTGRGTAGGGYMLHARFDRIDGLSPGADVRLAGVKVGSVVAARLDPKSFQAMVDFSVIETLRLPRDSSAQVSTAGLLGGSVLALTPGGDDATIAPGGEVTITQSAVSFEELLGKFIFNVADLSANVRKSLQQQQQQPQQPPKTAP